MLALKKVSFNFPQGRPYIDKRCVGDFRALLVGCESHFLVFQDWQMIIKFFLKIFAFMAMIASSGVYGADFDAGKELDKHCSSEYKRIDNFLQ
jgi:hypothetical protein